MIYILYASMNHFNRTPEFEREYKKLQKRFRSLPQDIATFETILVEFPTGKGTKFVILHSEANCKIVKARLMCQTLRKSSLRVIYAWHEDKISFVYIELYYKGDKENEDRERIKEYVKNL